MYTICVKLRNRENRYRKLTTADEAVFPDIADCVTSAIVYAPDRLLDDGEWFKINNVSSQDYATDLLKQTYTTLDFEDISEDEFSKIDYLFMLKNGDIYFQNISRSRLIKKRMIVCWGEKYKYFSGLKEIVISELPDAIYKKSTDTLYFRRLESITGIFEGIAKLYREATQEETEKFLKSDFIKLCNGYTANDVKKLNRKRIAIAIQILSALEPEDKDNIISYVGDYCPDLMANENSFNIGSEDELKLLLYGIEQRFYTTPVGNEKRIANSVIPFNNL